MEWRLRTGVSMTHTEYGLVLLDEPRGEYFQLNPTGAIVTDGLLAQRTLREIADEVARDYDVTREQALADIQVLPRLNS
jgi:Coenzyme PQQ synthesis protein D (PqqD)